MHDNIVLKAVLAQPDILRQIINDPKNHLNYHPMAWLEAEAIKNIERQAYGRRQFASASASRHAYYRKHTSVEERAALRLEITYLKNSVLKGWHLYEEIARVMSIKFKRDYSRRNIKAMLEFTSEVIADIEQASNGKVAIAA